jgi:hypothetical protein
LCYLNPFPKTNNQKQNRKNNQYWDWIGIGREGMKSDGRRRGPMQNKHFPFPICKIKDPVPKISAVPSLIPSHHTSSMITLLYFSKSKTKTEAENWAFGREGIE